MKHLVMVGDPQQLRPRVQSYGAIANGLEQSVMECLIRCNFPHWLLHTQFQMHPALTSFTASLYSKWTNAAYTKSIKLLSDTPFLSPNPSLFLHMCSAEDKNLHSTLNVGQQWILP